MIYVKYDSDGWQAFLEYDDIIPAEWLPLPYTSKATLDQVLEGVQQMHPNDSVQEVK